MKKILWATALSVFVLVACDKDDDDHDDNSTNKMDRDFTMKAAMANFAEVDAGQLADSKASDDEVDEYGEHMVRDHGTAQSELKDIADDLNLYAPDSLDAEHQALKTQLMALSGREFDSVYIHAMVKDHEMAIALFKSQASGGQNRRLVNYAKDKLPHLEEHLEKAENIAAKY